MSPILSTHYTQPVVGIGVLILKQGKALLGKRRNVHGSGEYAFTGGKLDRGESLLQCAKRETWEESGVEIHNARLLCVTNVLNYLPRHFLDIGIVADWKQGDPEVKEPHKVESWGWYDIDNLPSPLFAMIPNYVEALKTGRIVFDSP